MIDVSKLIQYAVKFSLGKFEIDTLDSKPPVYLERVNEGWVIRAEHPGSMNPYYLNASEPKPFWRYKRGTAFKTKQEAIGCFNEWLSVTAEGASSPGINAGVSAPDSER